MTAYEQLVARAQEIRTATQIGENTAERVGGLLRDIIDYLKNLADNISDTFLHANEDDVAYGLIKFLKGAEFGMFAEGVSGAYIDAYGDAEFRNLVARVRATVHYLIVGNFEQGVTDSGARVDEKGNAEFEELVTRALATLAALKVLGDSVFCGSLSSEDFISGFLAGKGWAIKKNEYVNAAGETEYKYTLEIDNITARGILRVYEMVASQMRGENDNVIFAARMKVDHYDPKTGKVWLDTEGEQLMCVFTNDDCIMVQRYQPGNDVVSGGDGYITKAYELVIDEWGSGGATNEAGERLDWVTFRNFTTQMEGKTAEDLIAKGDTFTRVDNLTNPERKGIVQIMTVGENRPHIDVIHSLKTDPDNALKGRMGNLEGIRHHLFGWLKGFGEYLINAYIVGDVRLRRTGESLDTLVEILNGQFSTKIAETVYDITAEENFLSNAGFTEIDDNGNLKDWTISGDDVTFYTIGDVVVVASVGTLGDVKSAVKTEEVEGKMVLHIVNGSATQSRSVMMEPGTHKEYDEGTGDSQTDTYKTVNDTLYLTIRMLVLRGGTLTIGFPGATDTEETAIKAKTIALERGSEWVTYQWSGTWNGKSDFVLGFTGECYVSMLSLTTEPLSTFKTEYSTQIKQTARNISLIATKTSANESSIAELRIEADRISSTVTHNYEELDGKIGQNRSLIEQTATSIRAEVKSVSDDLSGVSERVSSLEITSNSIISRVTSTEITISQHTTDISGLNKSVDGLESDVSGLHGDVTTITTRLGELAVTDSQISARVSTVETTTAKHTTDISGLNKSVDGLESDVSDLYSADVSIRSRVSSLEITSSSITSRVSQIESRPLQIDDVDGWEQGTTGEYYGATYDAIKSGSTTRIRTKNLYPVTDGSVCMLSTRGMNNYEVFFVYFTSSKTVCSTTGSGWLNQTSIGGKISVSKPTDCAFVAILLRLKSNGTISPSAVMATGITITSDKVVSQAEISQFIEDVNGVTLSHVKIKADRIDFETDGWTVKNSSGDITFQLDKKGNLTVGGTINGGSITGDVNIGNGTKFMKIVPSSSGAYLIGYDGSYETLRLGFYNNSGTYVPSLFLNSKNGYNSQDSIIRIMSGSDFAEVLAESAGSTGSYHVIRLLSIPRDGYATIEGNMWPEKSNTTIYNKLSTGAVYVDGGVLKVKGYS